MKKSNKGFTLVELIIVVAVIAILAGVLAPQYLQYVERARESHDIQIANSIVDAATIAAADPQNGLPAGHYIEVFWGSGSTIEGVRGTLLVRSPENTTRASIFSKDTSLKPIPKDFDLSKFAAAIIEIMGAESKKSDIQYVVGEIGMIGEAQSEKATSADLSFHINTSTGEIALATWSGAGDVNVWHEMGIDAVLAP